MGAPVSLRVGRFADLTRHRRVIQHRGPIKGEGLGVRRQERKTPTVAEASGRVSLRAGERRHSPFIRQRRQKAMPARIRGKSLSAIAREGFLDRRSKRCFWLLLSPQTKVACAGARNYPRRRQRKCSRRGAKLSPAETRSRARGREIAPAAAAGGGRKKDRRGRSFCLLFGCTAYWDLFCSFWSMAVNSGGRGQWSSTGSPVRGWMKRRPVAWRHWPVRPGTGFLAP